MKTTKLLWCALSAIVLAASGLTACDDDEMYDVGAPEDLQDRIDAAAAELVRQQEIADSLANLEANQLLARMSDDLYQVGATDNTTGFWGDFSKYYPLETVDDTVYVKFKNYTGGANVWCNWLIVCTTAETRNSDLGYDLGYIEYFVWRADNYSNFAWGYDDVAGTSDWNTSNDGDTHSAQQTTNYDDMATENSDYDDYMEIMNGADCTAKITRGYDTIYVDMTMEGISGTTLTKSIWHYVPGISDYPLFIFFSIENCHLVFYKTLNDPLDYYIPENDIDDNYYSGSVDEVESSSSSTSSGNYRVDVVAYIDGADGGDYTYTYYYEGLPAEGFGTFVTLENAYLTFYADSTYYCSYSDISNSDYWEYPYSEDTTIGETDYSTSFWGVYSENAMMTGESYFRWYFQNYSAALENWDNWVLALTNGKKYGSSGYSEYLVLRADAFGWDTYYDGDNLTYDWSWDDFINIYSGDNGGATVDLQVTITEAEE